MKQYVMIEVENNEASISSNIDSLPVLNEAVQMLNDYMYDLYHHVAMGEMDKAITAVKCSTTQTAAPVSNRCH